MTREMSQIDKFKVEFLDEKLENDFRLHFDKINKKYTLIALSIGLIVFAVLNAMDYLYREDILINEQHRIIRNFRIIILLITGYLIYLKKDYNLNDKILGIGSLIIFLSINLTNIMIESYNNINILFNIIVVFIAYIFLYNRFIYQFVGISIFSGIEIMSLQYNKFYTSEEQYILFVLILLTVNVIGFFTSRRVHRIRREYYFLWASEFNLNLKLQDALDNITTLKTLIPMCASCKNIRNDEGFWEEVDEYITKNTDSNITHGICPDCTKKLYPNLGNKN